MKKIISLTFVLVICATLFMGCSSKKTGGKVKITVPDRALTEQGANLFTKQKQEEFDKLYGDEIEVQHILPYASSDENNTQNIAALLLGNDAPAYVSVSSTIYMKELYNMGLVADISKYVKEDKEFEKISSNAVESCTYSDGKIIAYPTNLEVPMLGFYNKNLKDAGYNPENFTCSTWDDYFNAAKKMTTASCKGSSIYASEFFLWPQNWILSIGGQVALQNSDGTISLNYTDKKVVQAVEFLRKLYSEGLTNTNIGSADVNSMLSMIYQQKVASFTMYPTWISRFYEQGIDPSEITICEFPTGPSGESEPVMYVAGYIFNSKLSEEEIKAAIKYVSFMNSEETQNEKYKFYADNGIDGLTISCVKGVDWTVNLSNFPKQWINRVKETIEKAKDNQVNSTGYATYISAKLPEIIQGKGDITKSLKDAEALTKKEWLDDYNKNTKAK